MQAFLVMTTAGSAEEASRIAGALVARRVPFDFARLMRERKQGERP